MMKNDWKKSKKQMLELHLKGIAVASAIYFGAIIIGAVRFSGKAQDAPYDIFDKAVMLLLSPFFIAHRLHLWFRANWYWCVTELLPRILRWIGWKMLSLVRFIWNIIDLVLFAPIRFLSRKLKEFNDWICSLVARLFTFVEAQLFCLLNWAMELVVRFFSWAHQIIIRFSTWTHQIIIRFSTWAMELVVRFFSWAHQIIIRFSTWTHQIIIRFSTWAHKIIIRFWSWLSELVEWAKQLVVRCWTWFCEFVVGKLVSYVRFIWAGIYKHILYPLYYHVFYRFCYRFFYQRTMRMLHAFYEGLVQGLQRIYANLTQLYNGVVEQFLLLYARFSGNFWQKYEHLSQLYADFWQRYDQLSERLWQLYADFW